MCNFDKAHICPHQYFTWILAAGSFRKKGQLTMYLDRGWYSYQLLRVELYSENPVRINLKNATWSHFDWKQNPCWGRILHFSAAADLKSDKQKNFISLCCCYEIFFFSRAFQNFVFSFHKWPVSLSQPFPPSDLGCQDINYSIQVKDFTEKEYRCLYLWNKCLAIVWPGGLANEHNKRPNLCVGGVHRCECMKR